jgi:hypothetical protein
MERSAFSVRARLDIVRAPLFLPSIPGDAMTSWRTGYWRVYNILVRAFGASALVAGLGFIVWGVLRLLQLGLQPAEGTPGLMLLLVGLISAALGAGILGVPTYRPDLGDPAWQFDPFGAKARESPSTQRSWWTGDR